jgi:carbon storage regulator CsrA
MLVLTRKLGEQIVVPQCNLTVTVVGVSPARVRLGIDAPASVSVLRSEVLGRDTVESHESNEESLNAMRILIADQDEYLLTTYRNELSERGAAVVTAPTALACMTNLREFTPDVLVLEPELLWGGGDGVLAVMQEEPALRPPFVILLTRGDNRKLLYRLSTFKIDDFQLKPTSPQRLVDRICSLRRVQSQLTSMEPRRQSQRMALMTN